MTFLTPARPVHKPSDEPPWRPKREGHRTTIDLAAWQAETEVMPVVPETQAGRDNHRFDTRPRPALSPAGAGLIDEIATLIRSLTYGEMIELAQAMWKRRDEGEVTQATLPGILHRWASK